MIAPPTLSETQLLERCFALAGLHGDLLPFALSSAERVRLGSFLGPPGSGLADALVRALSSAPPLFPDAPWSGPELSEAQRNAYAWLLLRDRLQAMAKLADDACLGAHSRLCQATVPFVKQALSQAPVAGLPPGDLPRRNLALLPAFLQLIAYYKAQRRLRKQDLATAASAASGAPPLAPSRQRLQAAQRSAAQAGVDLARCFAAVLGTTFAKGAQSVPAPML